MNQLMETLFELLKSPTSTKAEKQAMMESGEILEAVRERLTLEEFDKFWEAAMAIEEAGYLDSFTLGFRLGVQLTLEGLKPIAD